MPHHLERDRVERHSRSTSTAPESWTVPRHPGSISPVASRPASTAGPSRVTPEGPAVLAGRRSEEHTSELQSLTNLVCRLLLEKKKKTTTDHSQTNIGTMCQHS